MKRLLALVLTFASMVSAAEAHHKPGHNPPGHMKHGKKVVIHRSVVPEREISRWAWADEIVIGIAGDGSVDSEDTALVSELTDMDWRVYRDTVFDFGIELPFAVFEPGLEGGRGLRLDQVGGGQAHLDVYGAENAQGLSPEQFVTMLNQGDLIGKVTYRAGGENWLVVSGYYAPSSPTDEEMIFYTKFMFSNDGKRISAFEIGYPTEDKAFFDPIVVRLEETLSAPTSSRG